MSSKTTAAQLAVKATEIGRNLTATEANVASLLYNSPGIVSTERITSHLYDDDPDDSPDDPTNLIRTYVYRLRHKGFEIQTYWGLGYRLVNDPLEVKGQSHGRCPNCGTTQSLRQ